MSEVRLIDANALKQDLELSKYIVPNDLNKLLNSEINRCIEAIDNAQTVEPTYQMPKDYIKNKLDYSRPQGAWVFVNPLQANDGGAYMCSNCKTGDYGVETYYKYCPFCGAEMKDGAE